jgi:hypothetical protein
VLGPILANYTAVLLGDTANPIWRGGRVTLPFVFSGSSMAAAGAALCVCSPTQEAGVARRMLVNGTVLDQAAFLLMERQLGALAQPYSEGEAGALLKLHRGAAVGGAALVLALGRRSRTAAVVGGLLSLAGSVALRQCVFRAGFQSAQDPKYTVDSQRSH